MRLMSNPYRIPGEKEPVPPHPFDWMSMFRKIWILIQVIFWISIAGCIVYGCHNWATEAQAERAARRNKCIVDAEFSTPTFAIRVYDAKGITYKIEGFFPTRREGEEYLKTLPQCQNQQ